jgi:histidinol dehydrogenase
LIKEGITMRIYINEDKSEYLAHFHERRKTINDEIREKVKKIVEDVRTSGDDAVRMYTKMFDNVELDSLEVTDEEIESAKIDKDLEIALQKAKDNIFTFHERELEKSWQIEREDGSRFGIRVYGIQRVGVYVPGGSAPLPSSVLMNIIPAKVAGVKEIIMCTPPLKDGSVSPAILKAAKIAGVDRIFKIGGAQAIAAMAYGTESVPRVFKITGPGNAYVACAKSLVFGDVGIDMIAGPSEIMIVADETANCDYIAADLLSQAEHDVMAASILVTTSMYVAEKVREKVNERLKTLERNTIAKKSIENNGAIIVVDNLDEAAFLSNSIAPEHLELILNDKILTDEFIDKFYNAGAIFLGEYSPEPMGDYFCGSNHVLPTGGTAAFSSPLGVWDFVKRTSIVSYTKEGFFKDCEHAYNMAMAEGLTAHAKSLKARCDDEQVF